MVVQLREPLGVAPSPLGTAEGPRPGTMGLATVGAASTVPSGRRSIRIDDRCTQFAGADRDGP